MCKLLFYFLFLSTISASAQNLIPNFIRPMIGSEGEGNVFVGASLPFGMVKPGPDCSYNSNSGHTSLNTNKDFIGISHTHVSGTGGGPKYGNILVTPMEEIQIAGNYKTTRKKETIKLGHYATTLNSNIKINVTATHSTAYHRYTFANSDSAWIKFDMGHFLGNSKDNDAGESQSFVGSEIEIVSPTQLRGYTRVKGGWNKGAAYTVYFYAEFDMPATEQLLYKNLVKLENTKLATDHNSVAKAFFRFQPVANKPLGLKVAISFISTGKAFDNLQKELPTWDFDNTIAQVHKKWNDLLSTIEVQDEDSIKKAIFYTALYHTALMPSDRTGENPLWQSEVPYYDDFYAIWDTYRTSFPLLTLINETRVSDIINSLIDTYKHTGYLPDARSGNENGLTQGGSNTDIVIADAFVKNVKGINYGEALEAMIKNAEIDPGAFHRKIGRGGIEEYKSLGYVSYNHERSGTRTVEYAGCDFALSQVARGLGKKDVELKYRKRSDSWKNLWRDTLIGSVKGYIWPKDYKGKWLDSTQQVKFSNITWKFEKGTHLFTSNSFGWGWQDVFYEGNSQHYSLHILHDINGLIEKCGGAEAFETRLDTFFMRGHYDVSNEPCFFTPVLYHYIGKPWKSVQTIRKIISEKYNVSPSGLPGNDDSGAMSSWYAFHAMGLYPNAGQDIYLINSPLFDKITIKNSGGNPFTIICKKKNAKCVYIDKATLNGKPYNLSWLKHSSIKNGGTLLLELSEKPTKWGESRSCIPPNGL